LCQREPSPLTPNEKENGRNMIKVKFDNRIIELEQPTKINLLLQKEIDETEALACMYNNEVKSLNKIIEEDCEIRLLNYSHKDGKRVYNRGIIYIMTKALQEVYPEALLTVNYHLGTLTFIRPSAII